MIDKDKILFDCGPVGMSRLVVDLTNPMHLRRMVRLDHEIVPELLAEAWEKTKRVYPIIDSVLDFDEGDFEYYREDPSRIREHGSAHMYFVAPDEGCNVPTRSKVPLMPGVACAAHRMVMITYYADTITMSAYHLLLDGLGFQKVFCTLLYTYLALVTGHEDENPPVELTEGRAIEEYYIPADIELIFSKSYTPVAPYELPEGMHGFIAKDMVEDGDTISAGAIEMDAAEFMRLCKSSGATPASMIATLLGRVDYALDPDQQEGVVFEFTVSGRQALGLEDSIANIVGKAWSYATADDYEHKSLAEIARHVRADMNYQRTLDYCVSYCHQLAASRHVRNFVSRTVTYVGCFSIGDNDEHVLEMGMGTNGTPNLYLFQVRDRFVMALHYGKATQRYLDEFARTFAELGVTAKMTYPAHFVDLDVETPVV